MAVKQLSALDRDTLEPICAKAWAAFELSIIEQGYQPSPATFVIFDKSGSPKLASNKRMKTPQAAAGLRKVAAGMDKVAGDDVVKKIVKQTSVPKTS